MHAHRDGDPLAPAICIRAKISRWLTRFLEHLVSPLPRRRDDGARGERPAAIPVLGGARGHHLFVGASGGVVGADSAGARFTPGISPEEAAEVASEFAHDDFAFVFEAFWDLWVPNEDEHGETWVQRPVAVKFLVHGVQFDEGIYTEDGHVEVDFGLDTSFVYEGAHLSPFIEKHLRANIAKLVAVPRRSRRIACSADGYCGRSRRRTWRRS